MAESVSKLRKMARRERRGVSGEREKGGRGS